MTANVPPFLPNHQDDGKKKLVPKILLDSQFLAVPYVDVTMSELLWIGLLNSSLGKARAAAIVHHIASAVADLRLMIWMPATSCLEQLSLEAKNSVFNSVTKANMQKDLVNALSPLWTLYPQFPGGFLLGENSPLISTSTSSSLGAIKSTLLQMYEPSSDFATFVCADAIYASFRLDLLRAQKGTSLYHFNEIEAYPNTEISKKVASAARSAVQGLMRIHVIDAGFSSWSSYFWNTNLTLEPINWNLMRPQQ